MRVPDKEPPNAAYLREALKYLETATIHEAIDLYEQTYRTPGCDDWLIAQLGKEDLFFLLTQILRRPDLGHPWLYERIREVEVRPDDHLDLWAREHYKSTIVTFGLTFQDILRDPEVTVGIFSHSRPIAKAFLRQIKLEAEQNDMAKALYPDVLWTNPKSEASKWSEDEGIVFRRKGNPKESTVEAWGLVDGQPTSKHFKKLVYDDVVTRESVNTPDMIKKTTEALELSYSLGTEGGSRRFVGTRYHFNDTYKTLIDRGTARPRIYPATVDGRPNGKPVLLSPESLAKKRRDMGIYTFGCQMLQNPKADESQGFREEWIQRYRRGNIRNLNTYLLVDPASSKKDSADYTSMWVVGLGPDENYYVVDALRDRLKLTQRAAKLFEWHRKYRPIEVRYEEYGLQADIEHIEAEMEARNYRFKITKVGGKVNKEDRIRRLLPLFEQGRIYLPDALPYTNVEGETIDVINTFIEEEYKAFPVSAHDDMLDGLARIAEPLLPLKWPSPDTRPAPRVATYEPFDQGMGL